MYFLILLLLSDTVNEIYKFDIALLQWSKLPVSRSDIPRGKLASLRGTVLLCGSGAGKESQTARGEFLVVIIQHEPSEATLQNVDNNLSKN